jgi:hypothetical protein
MWVIIALIWGLLAALCCIFAPIWESRKHFMAIVSHLLTCTPSETNQEAYTDTVKKVHGDAAAEVEHAAAKVVPPMSQ